jgi:hypothetical protein
LRIIDRPTAIEQDIRIRTASSGTALSGKSSQAHFPYRLEHQKSTTFFAYTVARMNEHDVPMAGTKESYLDGDPLMRWVADIAASTDTKRALRKLSTYLRSDLEALAQSLSERGPDPYPLSDLPDVPDILYELEAVCQLFSSRRKQLRPPAWLERIWEDVPNALDGWLASRMKQLNTPIPLVGHAQSNFRASLRGP